MITAWKALPVLTAVVIVAAASVLLFASPASAGLRASQATATSVTLNWTAPGDDSLTGTAAQYDLRYSLSTITAANWSSATQVTGLSAPKAPGNAESFEVTGLASNTAYYFAIKAGDEVPNWSALSNVIQKSTLQETTPPSTVADLAAGTVTSSTVALTWTSPGDDGNVGTATTYDIRYSTAAITSANWASATQVTGEPSPKTAGGSESFTVTGLNPSVTYYFAIETADEVPNWSTLSNVVSKATAAEAVAPSAIANLGAGSETATSVSLSWTAPGDDGNVGTAAQYDVRYSTAAITAANFSSATRATGVSAPKVAGSAESFVVTGLGSNTVYYFAVKTADEVPNWAAISNVVNRTTLAEQNPPAAITALAASTSGQTSVTLTWVAPGDDSVTGTATTYDIRYSTSPITSGNWSSAVQVNGETAPKVAGSAETFTVTGLSMSTTYYFAIKTADEVPNWSGLSNVISKATTGDITPPAAINDLSALPGDANGDLVLHWTAPGDDSLSGVATLYVIRYSTSAITNGNFNSATLVLNPPLPLVAGSFQTITLKGLTPGQKYYVAIKTADDKSNFSALSNVPQGEARLIIVTGTDDKIADLVSPLPNAVLPTAHPILTVKAISVSSTDNYYFEVATDSSFFGMVASAAVTGSSDTVVSWHVPVSLDPNRVYYWRSHADAYAYSAVGSFSVIPKTHPYPNPFRPTAATAATFTDLPAGSELVLLTASGEPIRHWSGLTGADVAWDGTNESGHPVASGTYLWYVNDAQMSGKLIVIR
jgi:hypothetical protein